MRFSQIRTNLAVLLFFFLSIAVAQDFPVGKPEELGFSGERLQRLTPVFEKYVADKKMAGSVVLVLRHGKVAYFKSFGMQDIESKSAMKNDAIFRIASQTKAMVSVGIMILQEEGKLLIGDPVGNYIPEFKQTYVAQPREGGGYDVVKSKRAITIRDLLTHTAGIGYGWGPAADKWKEAGIQDWYFANRDEPVAETIVRMAGLPMDTHPGEKFVYGYNTDILGVVIEKVSGKTLEEFLTTRIFDPLGMRDTHFYLPQSKVSRLAAVYSAYADKPMERAPESAERAGQGAYVTGPRKSFSGGAGLLSTANDYARFLQMMLNKGTHNGTRILSLASVDLMTTNHLGKIPYNAGQGFGLGFGTVENLGERGTPGSVGEFGWGGAYGSTYWVDPKQDMVVVYFKQLMPTNGLDDVGKLRALIYQAIIK